MINCTGTGQDAYAEAGIAGHTDKKTIKSTDMEIIRTSQMKKIGTAVTEILKSPATRKLLTFSAVLLCTWTAGSAMLQAQNTRMMMQNTVAMTQKTAIVAHRGYWNCEEAGYARNSIAALECAQKAGFAYSEFDVNMTSDGILLVVHDGVIGGKRIEDCPYSEFKDITLENGEKIPLLDDYLAQAKLYPGTKLVLELKEHSTPETEDKAVTATIKKLREYKLDSPDKVIFISFSINICKRFAEFMPGFTVQYLGEGYTPAQLHGMGITGIDADYNLLKEHPETVRQAKQLRMSVNCWTVNTSEEMQEMIKLGVGFITTDYPMEARKILGDKELRAGQK